MTNQKSMRVIYDAKTSKLATIITTRTEREDEYGIRIPSYVSGHLDVIAGMILEHAEQQDVSLIEMPRGGSYGVLTDALVEASRNHGSPLRIETLVNPEPPVEESINDAEPKLAGTIDPATIGTGSQAAICVSYGGRWVVATAERGIHNELRWYRHHARGERTRVGVSYYDERNFRLLSLLSPEGHRVEVTA